MRIEIITDYQALAALRPAWRELHDVAGGGPFSSHEWIEAWAEAFGAGGDRPRIACAWRDGLLVSALPMGAGKRPVVRNGPRVAGLGMLCADRAGFHDFLAAPGHEDAAGTLFREVLGARDWALADLSPLRPSPAWNIAVRAARDAGFVCRERDEIRAAVCDHPDGWEAYLAGRSKHFRKALKDDARRLRRHEHAFLVADRPGEDADRLLERILELSARSWKAHLGTDFRTDPRMSRFIRALWKRLAPQGRMTLLLLEIDGCDAAGAIGLDSGDTAYGFTVDFDERFARLSPGRTVVIEAMRQAIGRGKLRSNALRATGFLPRLATRFETCARLRVCRRASAVNAALAAQDLLRPIGKRFRERRKLKTRKRGAFVRRSGSQGAETG